MSNLFAASPPNGRLVVPLLPSCGLCQLWTDCHSPKMPVFGKGKKEILICGEAAGKNEDSEGRPFIGKAGRKLREHLEKYGIDADEDAWITNSIICRPHNKDGSNRKPSPKEIAYCRPNLVKVVKELKPKIIIPLGECAVKSLLGWLWKPKVGSIGRWEGFVIPDQSTNAWIVPNYHPSWVLRNDYGEDKKDDVKELIFSKNIKKAVRLKDRPWKEIPKYADMVKVFINPDEAAEIIPQIGTDDRSVSWDLECDSLKPDSQDVDIISCALSDGLTTIAFPWHGKAIEAMKGFLTSDIPKIGFNLKYEHRFIKKKLEIDVNNWVHDGMVAAHILDNRRGVSGLEFQAYALLGQPPWDQAVADYMKAKNSNVRNKLRQAELKEVLVYNGIDAITEWLVAEKQMKLLEKKCQKRTPVH